MDILDLIKAKLFGKGGGGGGSTITVEPLSVSENGEYEADEGYAYNPVEVAVPEPPAPVFSQLTATLNGRYYPEAGVDGFNSVTVAIPLSEFIYTATKTMGESGEVRYEFDTFVSGALFFAADRHELNNLGTALASYGNVLSYYYNNDCELIDTGSGSLKTITFRPINVPFEDYPVTLYMLTSDQFPS